MIILAIFFVSITVATTIIAIQYILVISDHKKISWRVHLEMAEEIDCWVNGRRPTPINFNKFLIEFNNHGPWLQVKDYPESFFCGGTLAEFRNNRIHAGIISFNGQSRFFKKYTEYKKFEKWLEENKGKHWTKE